MIRRKLQLELTEEVVTSTHSESELGLDVEVLASSWDPRSLSGPRILGPAAHVLLLKYGNRGSTGRSAEHQAEIMQIAADRGSTLLEVPFSSENVMESFGPIWNALRMWARVAGRPLRIGVDLSVVPRYVSLALLAKGSQSNLVSDFFFSYRSAIYPVRDEAAVAPISIAPHSGPDYLFESDPSDGLPDSPAIFTEGRWRTVHVPGLRGTYRPSAQQHFVVALGFEGDDTYRIVQQQEPDRVTAIVPDPPVYAGLEARCRKENDVLLRDWAGPQGERTCGALDAIGMDRVLRSVHDSNQNLVLLPVGTKPHALGMAVYALRDGRPIVLYRWPESHRESGAEAGESARLYHVHDLAAL